jgi:hypothetical protein
MSEEIKHEGLHAHRLAPGQNNPREVAFAEQWREENCREYCAHVLAELLIRRHDQNWTFCERVEQLAPYDQQSASVAATVIQWLGSNVGFCFLEDALKRCGYRIVRAGEGAGR